MSKAWPDPRTEAPRQSARPRPLDRAGKDVESVRIFGADVDVAHRRAGRDGGDRHALDEEERVALHQHAVGEGAAVALVGVADDIFLIRLRPGDRAPLDPRRKAGAASSAQARRQNFLDRRFWAQRQGAREPREAAVPPVVVERKRVDDAAAGEHEALLPGEEGNLLHPAKRLRMVAASQKSGVEQRRGVLRRQRAVTDATIRRLDFDHRLQPEEAAGACADNGKLDAPRPRLARQSGGDRVRADGDGGGVGRNENARVHRVHWV